jgi:type IV pili sensor histidine kinase/response regulator
MVSSRSTALVRPAQPALARATFLILLSLSGGHAFAADTIPDIRLSRYTTTDAAPPIAQIDPLEAIVQVSLPRSTVMTVGDAVSYLLLRTGYQLAPAKAFDEQARSVLAMPLPEVHRQLGPYSVRTALSVLVGAPFVLSVDPVQRAVSYRVDQPSVATRAYLVEQGGRP